MALTQQQVAFAVMKWLKQQGTEDALGTAVGCLSRRFDVQFDDAECQNYCDVGLDIDGAVKAIASKNASAAAAQEKRLKDFIVILKQKGYFKGVEEGTPAYFERYEMAKQKFNARNNPYEGLTADQLKTHGNQKMLNGQYQEAVDCYTKAIEMDSSSAIYFANRSAAYTHLKEYKKAIADCETSLSIDPNYSKAFSRLGTALFYDGNYPLAVEKYARALELDPHNESYQADLKAAEVKLQEVEASALPLTNGFDFSSMATMLQNPEFMQMAQTVMQKPEFAEMVNKVASNLGGLPEGTMPDFSQMFANLAVQQPADGSIPETINTPFGDIKREQLEGLQNMPEIKNNPKFRTIMEDVKLAGPMVMMKYMKDPEVLSTMTKLASSLFAGAVEGRTAVEVA